MVALVVKGQRLARAVTLNAPPILEEAMFDNFRWPLGTRVTKTKGSQWTGKVVGFYSTSLTAEGYAVESETERGSVQIYPVAALKELGDAS